MAVSVSRFKQAYPDFENTSNSLVSQKLTAALGRINTEVWGDQADQGQMALAAHLLSISPQGEQARLKMENRGTMYGKEWRQMIKEVTMGAGRVI
jgi:hypothetical protein